jgi:hypothetical protein
MHQRPKRHAFREAMSTNTQLMKRLLFITSALVALPYAVASTTDTTRTTIRFIKH